MLEGIWCNATTANWCYHGTSILVWGEVKTSCDSRLRQIYRGEGTLIPTRDRGNVSLLIISNNRTHQQMGLILRPYWSCGNAYKTQFSGVYANIEHHNLHLDKKTTADPDLIFSMRAGFQHYTIASTVNTQDHIARLQEQICLNAQRNLNNTRILLQSKQSRQGTEFGSKKTLTVFSALLE